MGSHCAPPSVETSTQARSLNRSMLYWWENVRVADTAPARLKGTEVRLTSRFAP